MQQRHCNVGSTDGSVRDSVLSVLSLRNLTYSKFVYIQLSGNTRPLTGSPATAIPPRGHRTSPRAGSVTPGQNTQPLRGWEVAPMDQISIYQHLFSRFRIHHG